MKFASYLLVFSFPFLKQSAANCSTTCTGIETCGAEDKECAACDPTDECNIAADASYCDGCDCPIDPGCTDAGDNDTECTGTATGGAEDCEECYWQFIGTACVVNPAYCDEAECLTCVEACDECEATAGCVYKEDATNGRECECPIDCTGECTVTTCTDDQICKDTGDGATCDCFLECDLDVNDTACGGNCADANLPICHADPDDEACMCVPDCENQQATCGSTPTDCGTDTCVLNEDYDDCECALVPLDCQPGDCTCTPDEICHENPEETACTCVPDCASQGDDCGSGGVDCTAVSETCELNADYDDCECSQGASPPLDCQPNDCTAPDCTADEICHANPDDTACTCVPDCASQGDDCGTGGYDCAAASDTCELNADYDDCECSQGPPIPPTIPPTDCQPADCTPDCDADQMCEDPDGTGCMCVPDCSADDANCGSAGYDCESASDTCVLTPDKTDCECSQGPPPTTTEDSTTAGAVANAGVIGALLMVMLLSLTAA